MKMKHLGTRPSAQNKHSPQNRPLVQTVPEFNAPLRQLHRSKDGVEIVAKFTASEWRMTHVESNVTHVQRPLDQTSPKRSVERAPQVHAPEFIAQLCCVPPSPS